MYIYVYICIYMYIFRGYRVTFFISPSISRFSVPYRPRVDRISLSRSQRMIRTTLSRYGTLNLDIKGDMKKVMR